MLLRECIEQGAKQFEKAGLYYGHGTDNAWDEAVYLALYVLKLPPDSPEETGERVLTETEQADIQGLFDARIRTQKPAPYLTHEAYFMGLPFYVDERVLIPRSPMAELIEKQFSPWIDANKIHRILDLCTGSGCIAIACAEIFPNAEIVATDISAEALDVAKINVQKYKLENKITLIQSDIFKDIPKDQKFDIIISNPPYVDKEDMEGLPKEYHHEPELALAAGKDGLDIVKEILKNAKKYLSDKGILVVEVGNSANALVEQFPDLPFVWLEFERGEGEVFLLERSNL